MFAKRFPIFWKVIRFSIYCFMTFYSCVPIKSARAEDVFIYDRVGRLSQLGFATSSGFQQFSDSSLQDPGYFEASVDHIEFYEQDDQFGSITGFSTQVSDFDPDGIVANSSGFMHADGIAFNYPVGFSSSIIEFDFTVNQTREVRFVGSLSRLQRGTTSMFISTRPGVQGDLFMDHAFIGGPLMRDFDVSIVLDRRKDYRVHISGSVSSHPNYPEIGLNGSYAFDLTVIPGDIVSLIEWDEISGDGYWGTDSNWTPSVRPDVNHDVRISTSTDAAVTGPNIDTVIKSLTLGGSSGHVTLDSLATATLTVSEDLSISSNGTMTVNGMVVSTTLALQPGGALITNGGSVHLGDISGSAEPDQMYVGSSGRFDVDGGMAVIGQTTGSEIEGAVQVGVGGVVKVDNGVMTVGQRALATSTPNTLHLGMDGAIDLDSGSLHVGAIPAFVAPEPNTARVGAGGTIRVDQGSVVIGPVPAFVTPEANTVRIFNQSAMKVEGGRVIVGESPAQPVADHTVYVAAGGVLQIEDSRVEVRIDDVAGPQLGTIQLAGGVAPGAPPPAVSPGIMTGHGIIEGNVINAGELKIPPTFVDLDNDAPHRADHMAAMHLKGDYTQQLEGTLTIQVNDSAETQEDDEHVVKHFLFVEGGATLDGALKVEAADGYDLANLKRGQRFRALTATGAIGATKFAKFDPVIRAHDGAVIDNLFMALDYRDKDVAVGDTVLENSVEVITLKVPTRPTTSSPLLTDHSQKQKLVIVTHGTNDSVVDPSGVVRLGVVDPNTGALTNNQLAAVTRAMHDFADAKNLDGTWDVVAFDWSEYATNNRPFVKDFDPDHDGTPYNPAETARIAQQIGHGFVNWLIEVDRDPRHYEEIQILSHSSGSWFLDGFTDAFKGLATGVGNTDLHLTFFDAFVGTRIGVGPVSFLDWRFDLGRPPGDQIGPGDLAEHYVDDRFFGPVPGTDENLASPVRNVEITTLDPANPFGFPTLNLFVEGGRWHAWPVEWYLRTVQERSGVAHVPCRSESDCAADRWGFIQSPLHQDFMAAAPDHVKPGQRLNWDQQITQTTVVGAVDFNDVPTVVSDTGVVDFSAQGGVTLTTGSPVILTAFIDLEDTANFMAFGFEFLAGEDGLLSTYFDGQLIGQIDGLTGKGFFSSESIRFGLGADYDPGTYSLMFRLDPFEDTPSILEITDVVFGWIGLVAVEGDANQDGRVDAADLNELALSWRQAVAPSTGADFNGDGFVDAADLNLLALNWQFGVPENPLTALDDALATATTHGNTVIPEPASVVVFGLAGGFMGLSTPRRRRWLPDRFPGGWTRLGFSDHVKTRCLTVAARSARAFARSGTVSQGQSRPTLAPWRPAR